MRLECIYWIALWGCTAASAFFGAHFLWAMLCNGGQFSVDINHYNEGWLEVCMILALSILGAVGLVSYMNDWTKRKENTGVVKQLFCSKCHSFITNYTQELEGTQLVKNGKPYGARCRSNTWVIDGKKLTGFFAQCPQGHINVIKDTPEMIAEAERLKYRFGQECTTHYRTLKGEKVTCNVMQPCSTCQAYIDYQKLIGGKEHGINQ